MTDAIEWVWTLINLAGVTFLCFVIRELLADRAVAHQPSNGNGRRGLWVRILIRHEALFLALQVLGVWAGVAAISRPNPVETNEAVIGGVMFIGGALVMDLLTILDLRDRRSIRNYRARVNDQ